ncbi:hypothetical protein KDE13_03990 [Campylobacter sp. faydin G-140]|uniref:hypothetical protein n=1 Tax=Campylobacter anatolicus TaxID=2829105 RepID=UPI001B944323|nr:hypothetical protein [Campylobacter anatolicus]MBR8465521.1 hypothetical protein [Campylobacter anatolicus]
MRHILLKEFYKFNLAFWLFVAMIAFCCAWVYFEIVGGFNKFGTMMYSLQVIYNKQFTYNHLDELNLAFGVIIGIMSMFFERQNGRIRVQLAFPHSYTKNMLTITLVPLIFLLVIFATEIAVIFCIFSKFFQPELRDALISTLIYSCIFSTALFLLSQSVMIEPSLKRIIASIASGVAILFLYFKINPDVGHSSLYYLNSNLWIYALICWVFCLSLLVLSLQNYKKGYIK